MINAILNEFIELKPPANRLKDELHQLMDR
jgi:hypothetical protein